MKRTQKVKVRFSEKEIEKVSERAEFLKMRTAVFIRNMSLRKEWRVFDRKFLCKSLTDFNRILSNLAQIIRVAEKTKSEYLDGLYSAEKSLESSRDFFRKFCTDLLNRK